MKKVNVVFAVLFLVVNGFAVMTGAASADDSSPTLAEPSRVTTRTWLTEDGWLMTFIRGEAARLIFENLSAVEERRITRHDHTEYRNRAATTISCSYSDLFPTHEKYLCAFATKSNGEVSVVVADPEMGGVARIGIGN